MSGPQWATVAVVFGVLILGLGFWEFWTLRKTKDPSDHITATMRAFSKTSIGTLVLMFASWLAGVICGHIWYDW